MNLIRSSMLGVSLLVLVGGCSKEEKGAPVQESAAPKQETAAAPAETAAPSAAPAATGQGTGTIAGKIVFKGTHKAGALSVGKDKEVCGTSKEDPSVLVDGSGGLKNVVVQVAAASGGKASAAQNLAIDQVKCEYVPHVIVIPAGTTLTIKNSDGILHNVHTYSKINTPFNKAQPKFMKEFTHTFDKAEAVSVKCDVHAWMSGWIYVTDSAVHDTSATDGSFKLANVPAGEHKIEIWHETLGSQTKTVKVAGGETAELTVEFESK